MMLNVSIIPSYWVGVTILSQIPCYARHCSIIFTYLLQPPSKKSSLEATESSSNPDSSITIKERKVQHFDKNAAKKLLIGLHKGFTKQVYTAFQGCQIEDEILEKLVESHLHPEDLSNLAVQAGLRHLCDYELVQLIEFAKAD